jgi:hypothetical protein
VLRDDFGSTTPYFHFGVQPALAILHQEFPTYVDNHIEDLANLIDFELETVETDIFQSILDATEAEIQTRLSQAQIQCATL